MAATVRRAWATLARGVVLAVAAHVLAGCATLPDSQAIVACREGQTLDRKTGARFDSGRAERPSPAPIVKVVEFSEEGELVERCDYSEALFEVKSRPTNPPPSANPKAANPGKLVVLYVHGWKHSARGDDEDLRRFTDLVERLTRREDALGQFRQVVGIYIGWPGSVISAPVVEELTFWGRKRAADRVSQAAYVSKLIAAIDSILCKRANEDDLFVAIGHSFGARVLFSGTSQVLLHNLQAAHPGDYHGSYDLVRGPADLIVLLNPAFSASTYTALDSSRRWLETFQPNQLPVLLTVSTSNDWATGSLFPLAQLFDLELRERQLTTLGNYCKYATHQLFRSTAELPESGAWFDHYCSGGVCLRLRRKEESCEPDVALRRSEAGNPFIVATTNEEILDGHNGFWEPTFTGWLTQFIATVDEKRRAAGQPARCVGAARAPSR